MYHLSSSSKQAKGQGLVEYALILVLVAIVVIGALMVLSPIISNSFGTINSSLSSVAPGSVGGSGSSSASSVYSQSGTCYLRWTGTTWVHWYDNTPEYPGACP
ncbi:MAG TPA: hypothetical protein VHM28_01475 [Anaerolineales bacterium]|nr:hypothetical protein [Anaerolineales bacterium]